VTLLKRLFEGVGVLLFAVMFLGFAAQVVSRYVLNRPVIWSNDLILVSYLWWFCWASAFFVQQKHHISYHPLFRGRLGRAIQLLAVLFVAAMFFLALPPTLDYLSFASMQRVGALDLRVGWMFAGFVVFLVGVPIQLFIGWWAEGGEA